MRSRSPPVDAYPAGRWTVQTDHHSHRGGLAGAVGAEEARDHAGPHSEGQVVYGEHIAVALGQAMGFDHKGAPASRGRRKGCAVAALPYCREGPDGCLTGAVPLAPQPPPKAPAP